MIEPPSPTVRILLVDDHALFRESVARLLATESGMRVVAHCGTTQEACRTLAKEAVDLVLLDFDLGDQDCAEFLSSAEKLDFHGKVLLVTAGVPESRAAEFIRRGISGVFMKHDSPARLSQAIREVMSGKVWFSQQFLQSTVAAVSAPKMSSQIVQLSDRERDVLGQVLEGLANKEIADRLNVTESSVKASLQQLFSKTGVRTRSQLVRVALEKYRDLL
jgi:two-component system nitrate/nitrite response regulator NarL